MPHSWLGTNIVLEGQCNFVVRWTFNIDLETKLGLFTSACVWYWEGASLDIAHKSPTSVLPTHLLSQMPHKALNTFDPQTITTWAPFDAAYPWLVLSSTLPDKLGMQGHPWDPIFSLTAPYPAISYCQKKIYTLNVFWMSDAVVLVPRSGGHQCWSEPSLLDPRSLPICGFITTSQASPDLTLALWIHQ